MKSLPLLVTLALILAYFTRRDDDRPFLSFSNSDMWRAVVLMISALPIAVLTNAARVTSTGVLVNTLKVPSVNSKNF